MSYPLMALAWEVVGIGYQAKLALLALADCCNQERDTNRCWPSLPWLTERTGLPRRSLIRALDELEARGLMERSRGKGHSSTQYRLILAPGAAANRAEAPPPPPQAAPLAPDLAVPLAPGAVDCSAPQAPQDRNCSAPQAPQAAECGATQAPQTETEVPPWHLSSATLAPRTRKEPGKKREQRERASPPAPVRGLSLSDPLAFDWRPIAGVSRPDLRDPEQVWAKFRAFYAAERLPSTEWARRWTLWLLRERENHADCRKIGTVGARAPGSFLATPVITIDSTCQVLHES